MYDHQARPSATSEWITPLWLLEALGPFDLDPCASHRQPWRTATRQITIVENGLNLDWRGRVWLNPPYGPAIASWLARLAEHGQGTALIFARTETAAWHKYVTPKARALLFIRRRLHFCLPNGEPMRNNAGAPSVLVAYGRADADRLRQAWLERAITGQLIGRRSGWARDSGATWC